MWVYVRCTHSAWSYSCRILNSHYDLLLAEYIGACWATACSFHSEYVPSAENVSESKHGLFERQKKNGKEVICESPDRVFFEEFHVAQLSLILLFSETSFGTFSDAFKQTFTHKETHSLSIYQLFIYRLTTECNLCFDGDLVFIV